MAVQIPIVAHHVLVSVVFNTMCRNVQVLIPKGEWSVPPERVSPL